MRKLYYSLLLLLLPLAFSAKAEEARLLRFPATNGEKVVFTYAGDLYSVPLSGGLATKLTSHQGMEIFARFSPDGKSIASLVNMTATQRFTRLVLRVEFLQGLLILQLCQEMMWLIVWDQTIL